MKTRFIISPAAALLLATAAPALAEEHKYLKAFPAAGEGQNRFVISLPHKERGEENAFKVELLVGREMLTDGVNQVRLGGTLEPKPLKGWGFTYYVASELGPGATTLIGVPPGTPKVKRFVHGPSLQIRYNSRLPIVVYVPEGAELRYRIWRTDEEFAPAEKG